MIARIKKWLAPKASPYKVEMFQDAASMWRWRIRHRNGEILATSEAYSARMAATATAVRLCEYANFAFDPGEPEAARTAFFGES